MKLSERIAMAKRRMTDFSATVDESSKVYEERNNKLEIILLRLLVPITFAATIFVIYCSVRVIAQSLRGEASLLTAFFSVMSSGTMGYSCYMITRMQKKK